MVGGYETLVLHDGVEVAVFGEGGDGGLGGGGFEEEFLDLGDYVQGEVGEDRAEYEGPQVVGELLVDRGEDLRCEFVICCWVVYIFFLISMWPIILLYLTPRILHFR